MVENISDETFSNDQKSVQIIAQELRISQNLASNDPKVRAKELRKLHKWLTYRSRSSFKFSEEDFMRIWKGLFYCMWMSDKPLVQEELANELGSLLQCFPEGVQSVAFFGCFLKTICLEWFGIDQWRTDKFLMLVRRMFRYIFIELKKVQWPKDLLLLFNKQLTSTVLSNSYATSLTMHVADVFLEELAKISKGDVAGESIAIMLEPFILFLAKQKDRTLMIHLKQNIFEHLLWQSDMGREFNEKYNAWKKMGFPTNSIHDLEKVEVDADSENNEDFNEDEENENLDPRAGNVDVNVPEIPINVNLIIENIEKLLYEDFTNTKSRKILRNIVDMYKKFGNGVFPLGVQKVPKLKLPPMQPLVANKVQELVSFEEDLYGTTRALKKLNKRKRRRILANLEIKDGINDENYDKLVKENLPFPPKRQKITNEWKIEDIIKKNKTNNTKTLKQKNKTKKKDTIKKKTSTKIQNIVLSNNEESSNTDQQMTVENNIKEVKINNSSIGKGQFVWKEESLSIQNGIDEKAVSKADVKKSEWDKPLENGEIEFYIPSKKVQIKKANENLKTESISEQNLVLNPFANKKIKSKTCLKGKSKINRFKNIETYENLNNRHKVKKVKIALHKNMMLKPGEYMHLVRKSPKPPFDAQKKPVKSSLKNNLTLSPIDPFYNLTN